MLRIPGNPFGVLANDVSQCPHKSVVLQKINTCFLPSLPPSVCHQPSAKLWQSHPIAIHPNRAMPAPPPPSRALGLALVLLATCPCLPYAFLAGGRPPRAFPLPRSAEAAPSDPLPGRGTDPLREEGEDLIRVAAAGAGADPANVSIVWHPERIAVTVSGELGLGSSTAAEVAEESEYEMYYDPDEADGEADAEAALIDGEAGDAVGGAVPNDDEEEQEEEEEAPSIAGIGRAINRALAEGGEGSPGDLLAQRYSIEVSTPGATDEIIGEVMFEAYRGFDVIVATTDVKKNGKQKVLEGKLVERTEDHTVVNVRGRMSKVRNDKVVSVRLPKARYEKGDRG